MKTIEQNPKKIRVGITGQSGFIGTHLYNTLGLYPDRYTRVEFQDVFFENQDLLQAFVKQCDVVVHLAAMNRHNDPDAIYNTNINLVKQLIVACEAGEAKPHVIFSSSTQEERGNPYGKSKKEGRQLFEQWAKKKHARFSGLIIPNVFGPFGHPHYNSVVATFCHQLTHNEQPVIEVDGEIKLIYVGNLVKELLGVIQKSQIQLQSYLLPHDQTIRVSALLMKLTQFRDLYLKQGILPDLDDSFQRNLFNTFVCYINHEEFFPFLLKQRTDERGRFVETMKLHSGGQVSFSTTSPGITRGNHFHTRKAERFAVIKGKARIEVRRIGTNKVMSFDLDGSQPSFVDMPIWHTHNITNVGDDELFTLFWINELYDPKDADTWFEKV